ncbi:MAG: NYN domain-containing protein [Candidatus Heimdallarchaeota archaeon]|nr:NYN domain-containing protein [Candidatus Heimdallarchaeota archaeon]
MSNNSEGSSLSKSDEEILDNLRKSNDRLNLRMLANDVESLIDVPMNLEKLSEQIEKYLKPFYENRSVAILWDVENITPSSKSLFIEGFLEYVEQFGRITIAQAYADWNKASVKKISESLSKNRFELIHVPTAGKNSSDFSLVSLGIEMAFKYPNIDSFILVSGDSDFRPLVRSLVRNGKQVHIVCDTKLASEALLVLADSFVDYRELIPGGEEIIDEENLGKTPQELIQDTNEEKMKEPQIKDDALDDSKLKENAYSLLAEAVDLLYKEEKEANLSISKVKFQMLNPNFDQKKLGFKKWSNFVDSAVKAGFVNIERKGSETILISKSSKTNKKSSEQTKMFKHVVKIMKELDETSTPKYHRFDTIANILYEKYNQEKLKNLGFKQIKNLMQSLETRNLIETKAEGMIHFARRIK